MPASLTSYASSPQTKAARLVAALRLGTLACKDTLTQQHFDTPETIYNAFGPEMRALDREVLAVVLLDTRFRLIKFEKLSQGTVNETLAHPREILKPAIIHSAYVSRCPLLVEFLGFALEEHPVIKGTLRCHLSMLPLIGGHSVTPFFHDRRDQPIRFSHLSSGNS